MTIPCLNSGDTPENRTSFSGVRTQPRISSTIARSRPIQNRNRRTYSKRCSSPLFDAVMNVRILQEVPCTTSLSRFSPASIVDVNCRRSGNRFLTWYTMEPSPCSMRWWYTFPILRPSYPSFNMFSDNSLRSIQNIFPSVYSVPRERTPPSPA